MRRTRAIAAGVFVSIIPLQAAADGEATPMIGGSVVWSPLDQDPSGMLGLALEAAWWHGRVGVAVEGSGRSYVQGDRPHALTLGTSLRLRLWDCLQPSLMEPSDVEVGVELQGILERFWWEGGAPNDVRYGVGVALRVRGGADDGSLRLAESRFFLRVMTAPAPIDHAIARSTTSLSPDPNELVLLLGVGAAFGGAERGYFNRFRWHGFEWPVAQRGPAPRPGGSNGDSAF